MSERERMFRNTVVHVYDDGSVNVGTEQWPKAAAIRGVDRIPLALFLLGGEDFDAARERTIENYRAEVERLTAAAKHEAETANKHAKILIGERDQWRSEASMLRAHLADMTRGRDDWSMRATEAEKQRSAAEEELAEAKRTIELLNHDRGLLEFANTNMARERDKAFAVCHDRTRERDMAEAQLARIRQATATTGTDLTPEHLDELADRILAFSRTIPTDRKRYAWDARRDLETAADKLRRARGRRG